MADGCCKEDKRRKVLFWRTWDLFGGSTAHGFVSAVKESSSAWNDTALKATTNSQVQCLSLESQTFPRSGGGEREGERWPFGCDEAVETDEIAF